MVDGVGHSITLYMSLTLSQWSGNNWNQPNKELHPWEKAGARMVSSASNRGYITNLR